MKRLILSLVILTLGSISAFGQFNLSITTQPYLNGGLFTNPVIGKVSTPVTVTVRAQISGQAPAAIKASLRIADARGVSVAAQELVLKTNATSAEAAWKWTPKSDGLYEIRAQIDSGLLLKEDDETDNEASITFPVTVANRPMHFVWYHESPNTRWATCITSVGSEESIVRLGERGVAGLNWEYAGMSWSYYDKENAKNNPADELTKLEQLFYDKLTRPGVSVGFGLDECGGYPGTWPAQASIASMRALVRAREVQPDRIFAVWNGGGISPELAAQIRLGADFLLLETYLWRATPDELGADDIYQVITDRIDPTIRSMDMFQPAYGNRCYTLLALDTSERPDRCDLGEQENVVRFIRQHFPEMRGIAWYNSGYGPESYGLKRTKETDRQHEAVLANADRLCLEYFIKPCLTFLPQALFLTKTDKGYDLVAAVSNIGGMNSGPVTVEFLVDGAAVGTAKTGQVPAGNGRNQDRAILRYPIALSPGPHTIAARIVDSIASTVVEPYIEANRFLH
ncbi:MAG: hypothetical protein K1Y02_19650 [Candidatus Hydrogenedentes bacterium]|nr:hypothetical protein [Candidatus Hydrogenedentota bacterium]